LSYLCDKSCGPASTIPTIKDIRSRILKFFGFKYEFNFIKTQNKIAKTKNHENLPLDLKELKMFNINSGTLNSISSLFPKEILFDNEKINRMIEVTHIAAKSTFLTTWLFLFNFATNKVIKRNIVLKLKNEKPSYAPSGSPRSGRIIDHPEGSINDKRVDLNSPYPTSELDTPP